MQEVLYKGALPQSGLTLNVFGEEQNNPLRNRIAQLFWLEIGKNFLTNAEKEDMPKSGNWGYSKTGTDFHFPIPIFNTKDLRNIKTLIPNLVHLYRNILRWGKRNDNMPHILRCKIGVTVVWGLHLNNIWKLLPVGWRDNWEPISNYTDTLKLEIWKFFYWMFWTDRQRMVSQCSFMSVLWASWLFKKLTVEFCLRSGSMSAVLKTVF